MLLSPEDQQNSFKEEKGDKANVMLMNEVVLERTFRCPTGKSQNRSVGLNGICRQRAI